MAAGHDARRLDLVDLREPIDGRGDVLQRAGPAAALLSDAPVLDVPRGDPARGEVDARAGSSSVRSQPRPPEAAVEEDDARPRPSLARRQVEIRDLVGVVAVCDARRGRRGLAPRQSGEQCAVAG